MVVGRARGRGDGVPGLAHEAVEPRLAHRRQVGKGLEPFGRRDAERPDRAALHLADGGERGVEDEGEPSRDQVHHRLGAARVGDVDDALDPDPVEIEDARDVGRRPCRPRSVLEGGRVGAEPFGQRGEVGVGRILRHAHHHRDLVHHGDAAQGRLDVHGERFEERDVVDELRGGADEQRVAVGGGVAHVLGRAHARGFAVVLDHDALADHRLERLGDDAGDDIGIAAAALGDDEADRPGRGPGGGAGGAGKKRDERRGKAGAENGATGDHVTLLSMIL
jgi:hypothetical protein